MESIRIMARRKTSIPVWLRRLSQTAFFCLFLYLFVQAVYQPVNRTGQGVKLFFQLDPLALLSTWISARQVASGLLLSLVTLGVTLLAGRWFCGWVCPFGALHNLLNGWRRSPAKHRIAVGGYSGWQKSKYYILAAVLVGTALGLNLAGWFDPFSFLYRALAVVLFPAVNDATREAFTWIYQADPGVGPYRVTAVSEPVYEVLRRRVLAATQPHYYGAALIAILFIAVVLLNLYRARFWCRYVCPLGALLGIAGKNPLVRLERNRESCNNCGLCTADCQGGADPATGAWKPSECFYCWNCRSACPRQSISFSIGPARGEKR
jgi:polyferredoxin